MIYGPNYRSPSIPSDITTLFSATQWIYYKEEKGASRRTRFNLDGVATTSRDLATMIISVDNGHRKIAVHTATHPTLGLIYGVYVA